MNGESEIQLPPDDPVAFESLCLDLWKEIWGDPGAQKNGRSGQPQAGVDVYGRAGDRWIGVQCKQKNGLLRKQVTVRELEKEVEKAKGFKPPLSRFILATSGEKDVKVQKRARQISDAHRGDGLFEVEVWGWPDIRHEIARHKDLLERIFPIYWPLAAGLAPRIEPTKLKHAAATLFGREADLAWLDAVWEDPAKNVVTLVAWGGVGKTALVASWVAALAARGHDGADYFDWSFYSQGTREEGGASADAFVKAALKFFGDPEMARSRVPTGCGRRGRCVQLRVSTLC